MNNHNPIIVEVIRGRQTESRHSGAICVCNPNGDTIYSVGDVETAIYPRSAVKAIQGINAVESGAVKAFGLNEKEIAVMCSSHSGEEEHIKTVRKILKKAEIDESELECGKHWSSERKVMIGQARQFEETPPAVYNNCSGKHAGFLITAKYLGMETKGYVNVNHPIQKQVAKIMGEVMGVEINSEKCGTDGCSIPTYAVSLKAMATGFARLVSGERMPTERTKAVKQIVSACVNEPYYVAGTGRFCTKYMENGKGELFAKTGAEGVFCGGLVNQKLGISLKCDDGATRASEIAMAAITWKMMEQENKMKDKVKDMMQKNLRNWNRIETGKMIPVFDSAFQNLK